ncbi:MAG TPA: V-type ATPase 116kDa subunit family protein [Spirochaetota bacterium]|mgnify:CR=1 FL=1|nr:V-type ATPase 116kDa subunit family protein [Spirochaetota bacterium]HPJ34246.1 V-type ATPase 116kDa subunit family protein [Spirochaetota bacterium]
MFKKSDIRRVNILVPADRHGEFMVELGRSGLMHLDPFRGEDGADHLAERGPLSSGAAVAEKIISIAEKFFGEDGPPPEAWPDMDSLLDEPDAVFSRHAGNDLREVVRITAKKEQYERVRNLLQEQIAEAGLNIERIRKMRENGFELSRIKDLKFISSIYGTVEEREIVREMNERWFYYLSGNMLLVLFPAEERRDVLRVLSRFGFEESEAQSEFQTGREEALRRIEERLETLKYRLQRVELFYENESLKQEEQMQFFLSVYSILLRMSGAESTLRFSEELAIISGWIDVENSSALWDLLRNEFGNSFYLWVATLKENRRFRGGIPVLLKNINLFRPFELLVKMMGTPGNSEVDPTPVAAIAYTLIFGVMFGDVGQGLVLAAAGVMLWRFGRKKHGRSSGMASFGGIMIWCGLSSVLFGFLYGSVFSNEHLLPALLFHPMENMMELFLMAITMGVVFISAGLLFSIVNGIIAGHYEEALFGTRGAAGLAVYLSVIFFVMRYVLVGTLPDAGEFAIVLLPPALLFVIRGPLGYILFHGEAVFPHGIFEYTVESLVEVIEMFSNFVGNTISYIRAGAFALSHAGLSIAVFTLAEIVDPSMKSVGAVSAIIIGNVFIILLEGLVCSIQSMRLEYYEFFGKFFRGDGIPFAPFSLKFKEN